MFIKYAPPRKRALVIEENRRTSLVKLCSLVNGVVLKNFNDAVFEELWAEKKRRGSYNNFIL